MYRSRKSLESLGLLTRPCPKSESQRTRGVSKILWATTNPQTHPIILEGLGGSKWYRWNPQVPMSVRKVLLKLWNVFAFSCWVKWSAFIWHLDWHKIPMFAFFLALLRIRETTNTKTFIWQTHIHKNINPQGLIPQGLNHQDFELGNPSSLNPLRVKWLNPQRLWTGQTLIYQSFNPQRT